MVPHGLRRAAVAAAGVVPVFLALLIGGLLGVLAGYVGGLVNSAIMRVMDVLYAFPSVLLAIAICRHPRRRPAATRMLALTISLHPAGHAASRRASPTQVRGLDFVEAARASGARPLTIMRYHILNNVLGPILVYATQPDQRLHHPGRGPVLPRPRRHAAEPPNGA